MHLAAAVPNNDSMDDVRLFHQLYPLSPPARSRSKPLRLLVLGLPRTGTSSLSAALPALGLTRAYHGPAGAHAAEDSAAWLRLQHRKQHGATLTAADFDAILGDSDALLGAPARAFAPELIAAYPEAKVVVVRPRDTLQWQRDMERVRGRERRGRVAALLCLFHARLFWLRLYETRLLGEGRVVGQALRDAYADFYARLDRLAPDQSDWSLRWTVEDGWAPLCSLLSLQVPDAEFPEVDGEHEGSEGLESGAKHARQAVLNMVGTLLTVFMVMWWYFAT